MAQKLIGINVFLASLSNLVKERENFKKIIWDFNEKRASIANVIFLPVMSEQMTGGTGQAQGRINKRIEDCDYCITLFFDDLGSPPEADSPEGSVSVTDGEYRTAVKLKENGNMKEVVLFFKDVPSERVHDRGPKLTSLLDYKEERKKDSHIVEFANEEQFKEKVNDHLYRWLMDTLDIKRQQRSPSDVLDYEDPDKESKT